MLAALKETTGVLEAGEEKKGEMLSKGWVELDMEKAVGVDEKLYLHANPPQNATTHLAR